MQQWKESGKSICCYKGSRHTWNMTKGQAIENFEILLQSREHTRECVQLWKVDIIVQCKTTFQPSYCIVAFCFSIYLCSTIDLSLMLYILGNKWHCHI